MSSTRSRPHRLRAAVTAFAFSPSLLSAQGTIATAPGAAGVMITGNPLRSAATAAPSNMLSGNSLVLRRGSTMGETLDGLPGLSSSYFGPNANRPMIRGQDGGRVRMLSNSGVPLDASALSYDHAVPIDPLVVERIEVLRGPSALLYGGGAIGGVVNAIDNRIPKAAIDGSTGAAELRYGGPATERGAGAIVETGGKALAFHADGFWRKTDDMKVPWYQRPTDGVGLVSSNTIINSASNNYGGAVGASMVWDKGYLGASLDTFHSDYGTVAEEDVTIDMYLNKLTVAGEVRDLGGFISALSGQWLASNYQHQEIGGSGEVATTFKNKGSDLRLQAEHRKIDLAGGSLAGVFGLQTENADFSALGEEAFVPSTTTRQFAVFALEEWTLGDLKLSLGGRIGHSKIDSEGDAPGKTQFGPAQSRSFTPLSAAVGGIYDLAAPWQLSANLAYTERAPSFYELYANGLHLATGAYEVGDPNQEMERGINLDLMLQWKQGHNLFKAGAFYSDFSNYIALLATGQLVDTDEGPVPEFNFTGVPAKLYGMEFEGTWRVLDSSNILDLVGKLDVMRATNEAGDQPLPRIPPLRLTVGANSSMGPWAARAEVVYAAEQDRVPTYDVPTPAYTIVNLAASYKLGFSGGEGLLFLRINNVTNELAYNATTIGTVRPLAPLPGRGVMAGLRISF